MPTSTMAKFNDNQLSLPSQPLALTNRPLINGGKEQKIHLPIQSTSFRQSVNNQPADRPPCQRQPV